MAFAYRRGAASDDLLRPFETAPLQFLRQAGRRAHRKWDLYQLLMLLVCTFPAFWEASTKLPLPLSLIHI